MSNLDPYRALKAMVLNSVLANYPCTPISGNQTNSALQYRKCYIMRPATLLQWILPILAQIIIKNESSLKKVKLASETPDLPFFSQKFSTIASFLSRLWMDLQKQGENPSE